MWKWCIVPMPNSKFFYILYNCTFNHLKEKVCTTVPISTSTFINKSYFQRPTMNKPLWLAWRGMWLAIIGRVVFKWENHKMWKWCIVPMPNSKFFYILYNCTFNHLKEKVCTTVPTSTSTFINKSYFQRPTMNKPLWLAWRGMWLAIIGEIWYHRNSVIFKQRKVDPIEIFSQA